MTITELLQQEQGIQLDIGCGANKQPGFVGIDIRPLDGVDIIHDLEVQPWPLDRKSTRLNSSHSQQSRMPSSA